MNDWNDYKKNTENLPPNQMVLEGISYAHTHERALDIGCGAMRDTKALIEAGFKHVDAVDSNDVTEIAKNIPGVTFYPVLFHEFYFSKNVYDFVNAQNSIPFAGPMHFDETWTKIENSIASKGVFTGTFFGVEDGWFEKRSDISFVTKEHLLEMFNSKKWSIQKMDEYIGTRKMANGNEKMWHVFSVIAIRL